MIETDQDVAPDEFPCLVCIVVRIRFHSLLSLLLHILILSPHPRNNGSSTRDSPVDHFHPQSTSIGDSPSNAQDTLPLLIDWVSNMQCMIMLFSAHSGKYGAPDHLLWQLYSTERRAQRVREKG